MTTIDYVVRDTAGALERGVVPASGGTKVVLTSGQEISFNLGQTDLQAQQRQGDDLVLVLADGRTILLENYFNDAGVANRLFISSDGFLNEVAFVETTDGELFAQFGPTEQWGKWSPSDDLIYLGRSEVASANGAADEEVSMLGAAALGGPLLGLGGAAAAVAGVAVITGDGDDGGGSGGSGPAAPTVDNAGTSTDIGGDDTSTHIFDVSGTGEPGDSVAVTVGGVTLDTTIADDGTWSVTFVDADLPADGSHTATAVFTHDTSGDTTTLDGPSFVIDTVGPDVAITQGTQSVGHVVNGVELDGGVTLAGTGEAGATVAISIAGVTRTTTVGADGTWSATWHPGTLVGGEYSESIEVVATDAFGNTTSVSDTLVIDTDTLVTLDTASVEGDGVINAAEASDGVTVTGTAQPGATVEVTLAGTTVAAAVSADGSWSADFAASAIADGEYDADITAIATDTAGNTATATGSVRVDTLVNAMNITSSSGGADGVINAAEHSAGMLVTGATEPGSTVAVTLGSQVVDANVAADGTWTASFTPGQIPTGTYSATMTATATDAAGNTSSVTQAVNVDTEAGLLTIVGPVEGDDIVNGVEASDGVILSGTADPGALVSVSMNGVSHQAVANGSGTWQAYFAGNEVPAGTYDAHITATTTDAAGNSTSASDTVRVDTNVDNLSLSPEPIEGDDIISEAERSDGVVLTGTTEIGSTVIVSLGGATVQAVVDAAGNWTAPFAATDVPTGEYTTTINVTATDLAGNVASVSDTVQVDTLVNQLDIQDTVTADDIINGAEARDGITLGGQVEPGSTVMVDFQGSVLAATVDTQGTWSLAIPPSAIPAGTYTADITVMATDAVGNTDAIADTLQIDTEAPDGPVIASFTRDGSGLRGISTDQSDGDLAVAAVGSTGTISDVAATQTDISVLDETLFTFDQTVPDGSDLVVTSTDAVGNVSGTYVAFDDETPGSTIALGNPALGNYQIEQVDLQFAEEAQLTITEAALLALSDGTDQLTVDGGSDDTVAIVGATLNGNTTIGANTYDVYTLGEGTVLIDDDIQVNTALT
ncbi:MAG: Ig-like domain-containing protein [Pseudomonadota bacterium]